MFRLFPALLVLTLLAPTVHAESEIYGGVGVGYSTFSVDPKELQSIGIGSKFEASGIVTRQFVGYRYGEYAGLELGYINFGTVKDQVAFQSGQPGPSLNYSIKTTGYDLAFIGRYPLDAELAAFGKIGLIRWDSVGTLETFPLPTKKDGDDLIWGLGLDYRGSDRVRVRVQADFVDIQFANSWWVLTTSVMYGFPFGR
ncbi:MAG: outer membrane beta-barrel protein [Gammaproteobacteria bacterium]